MFSLYFHGILGVVFTQMPRLSEGLPLTPKRSCRIQIELQLLREFCLNTDMPFRAGKPPRSPHDKLCGFCNPTSGNSYLNNGFRRECHRCHLANGEALKASSEKREPPARSTKESARVVALEKELVQFRQTAKKAEEASQQEGDAPSKAACKLAMKAFGQLQTAGLFSDDHPATRSLTVVLDKAKTASDESVPLSKRIRAGQNQIGMHE